PPVARCLSLSLVPPYHSLSTFARLTTPLPSFLSLSGHHPGPHSFPTRRSSDLNSKLSLPMAVSLANALDVSVDEFLCDSVIRSKVVFLHEVQQLLDDCDDYEIRILTDLLKAAKTTIRRDMKLKQQE